MRFDFTLCMILDITRRIHTALIDLVAGSWSKFFLQLCLGSQFRFRKVGM